MVFDKIRKGLRTESALVAQIRAHQWKDEAARRDLLERFVAQPNLEIEDVIWTAVDPMPEVRAAGLAILKRRGVDREVLDALMPLCRTRSDAIRRAVQRFIKELAGPELPGFLAHIADRGDDFAKLTALELARELPPDRAFGIFKKVLQYPNPILKARALKAVSETKGPGTSALAANLALPLLKDEDEETRISALAVLEQNPSEALISHVLELARSGGGRVVEAAFAALKRLLPVAQTDHTPEILPLLADGNPAVRAGALALLSRLPGEELARRFVAAFRGTFVWIRDRALETVSKGSPQFVPALLRVAGGSDPDLAAEAFELSLMLTDPRALPAWFKLLDHSDWWIRSRAIENLGKFGSGRDDVVQQLLGCLKDPEVSLAASSALGDLGDPRAAGPLFELFKVSKTRPDDQLEVLSALAKLAPKEPKIGPLLANISTHPSIDQHVREKARRLVGKVQGEAALAALPPVHVEAKPIDFSAVGPVKLVDFLADTVGRGASDFHLSTGFVPHQRIHGTLVPVAVAPTSPERAEELIRSVLSEEEWRTLEKDRNLDVCIKVPGLGRFRANFFSQRLGFDACFRVIPANVPVLEEIGLPESAWELTRFTQGLVLVTGPAGCGKSTTLAALVNRVNETRAGHIITVEDPVEFVHQNKECLVNQRQVPHHTVSFARALKAALREDPDVIMVGEMRDLETIQLAISASETGHLVFGTLSTTTAPATVDRIINSFPAGQQGQIRMMVSESLKAVISQTLLPRRDGYGRVAAFEILRGTPAVGALIRDSKTYQLASALQTGQLSGMNTMDQALLKLAEDGKVDVEAAMDRAVKKDPFEKLLSEERLELS